MLQVFSCLKQPMVALNLAWLLKIIDGLEQCPACPSKALIDTDSLVVHSLHSLAACLRLFRIDNRVHSDKTMRE